MAQGFTLAVENLTSTMKAYQRAERDERLGMRHALRGVGAIVQRRAVAIMQPLNTYTAAGYKVRVTQKGVAVEQSRRKTTGAHPEWGAKQMKEVLLVAAYENRHETERAFEHVLDQMAGRFNREGIV